jgi:hypothetical protein
MIVEDRYYLSAFQRSRMLAAGLLDRTLVVGLISAILGFVGLAPIWVFGELVTSMPSLAPTSADSYALRVALLLPRMLVLTGLLSIAAPPMVLPGVLLYLDARVRKEGLDVELLSDGLSLGGACASSTKGGEDMNIIKEVGPGPTPKEQC